MVVNDFQADTRMEVDVGRVVLERVFIAVVALLLSAIDIQQRQDQAVVAVLIESLCNRHGDGAEVKGVLFSLLGRGHSRFLLMEAGRRFSPRDDTTIGLDKPGKRDEPPA